jgi:hypothetical protein
MGKQIRRVEDIKDHRYADDAGDQAPADDASEDVEGHGLHIAGEPDSPDGDVIEGRGFLRR